MPNRRRAILESVHARDLATIMYTSGSTGEPKGVMRTQDNLLSNITNGQAIVVSKPEEMTVIVLSLNHLLGRFGFLKSAVAGRTTAIVEATELATRFEGFGVSRRHRHGSGASSNGEDLAWLIGSSG